MASYWRTLGLAARAMQQLADALVRNSAQEATQSTADSRTKRPSPVGKEVRATLDGKDVAFERLTRRVAQREGQHIQHRVALTDGAEPLQRQVNDRLSTFTLVLDIIHVVEYLWQAVNALLGEKNPDRTAWVKEHLLLILSGRTSEVIQTLQERVQDPSLSTSQCQAVQSTLGYYQRNLPYMRYDQYLAQGWPIGTGVVEGACGHLVKDRMEQSAMRWTQPGAQAVLDLRAVRINHDWDDYQRFRRRRQHQRLYGAYPIAVPIAEICAFGQPAQRAA